ncbi:MAG: hypothetical protein AB1489_01000 [Acidobacteriota bacterium]
MDQHVLRLITEKGINGLSESELALIQTHTEECRECLRAYQAARLMATILKARVNETVESTPFFHTRVMATLRERHSNEETTIFYRLWRMVWPTVSAMLAVIIALLIGNFILRFQASPSEQSYTPDSYTVETLILEEGDATASEQINDNEVFSAVFGPEDENGQDY